MLPGSQERVSKEAVAVAKVLVRVRPKEKLKAKTNAITRADIMLRTFVPIRLMGWRFTMPTTTSSRNAMDVVGEHMCAESTDAQSGIPSTSIRQDKIRGKHSAQGRTLKNKLNHRTMRTQMWLKNGAQSDAEVGAKATIDYRWQNSTPGNRHWRLKFSPPVPISSKGHFASHMFVPALTRAKFHCNCTSCLLECLERQIL